MSKPKNAKRSTAVQRVYQLHIEPEYMESAIWRRLWRSHHHTGQSDPRC